MLLLIPLIVSGMQLDSIVTKEYNTIEGDSTLFSKDLYYYDVTLVRYEHYNYRNNEWCLSNYTINEFQNNQLIVSETYSNFNSDSIEPKSRTEYYDNYVIDYYNHNDNWVESVKTENLNDTCVITYLYMNKWVNSNKTTYRYSGNNLVETIIYLWENENWQIFDRTVYTYDSGELVEKLNYSDTTEKTKIVYEYSGSLLTRKTEFTKNGKYWLGENQINYSYSGNEIIEKITFKWSVRDSMNTYWSNSEKVTYNDEGNEYIEMQFTWSKSESEWLNILNTIFTYNNEDSIVKASKVYPESNSKLVEYYYYSDDLTLIEKPQKVSQAQFYPNPFSDHVRVKNGDFYLSHIYDINGSLLISSDSEIINTSQLSSGIYFIKHNDTITKMVKK